MNNNLTQPDEINFVLKEFSESFDKSEIEYTPTLKSKSSKKVSDDEYYIPLYKTSFFN